MRILIKSLEISKRNLSGKTFSSGCYKKKERKKRKDSVISHSCMHCVVFVVLMMTIKLERHPRGRVSVCSTFMYIHIMPSLRTFYFIEVFFWLSRLVDKNGEWRHSPGVCAWCAITLMLWCIWTFCEYILAKPSSVTFYVLLINVHESFISSSDTWH